MLSSDDADPLRPRVRARRQELASGSGAHLPLAARSPIRTSLPSPTESPLYGHEQRRDPLPPPRRGSSGVSWFSLESPRLSVQSSRASASTNHQPPSASASG